MNTGFKLQHGFYHQSLGAQGELALFRALIRAFGTLGDGALAKEYHGNRYQVTFKQARGAGRLTPRCELCDVLIIHYPMGNPSAARITFNQVKVASKPFSCHENTQFNKPFSFRANLEQWDLLSNRPHIGPATRTFNPPPDLLAGALLPSVGTFGVFYPVSHGFDFAYFVANGLTALNNLAGRSGTLQWANPLHQLRTVSGHREITATCCIRTFGDALDMGYVGTPVTQLLNSSTRPSALRAWLTRILVTLRRENQDSELPNELMEGLDLAQTTEGRAALVGEEGPAPGKAVVVVRTDTRHQNLRD